MHRSVIVGLAVFLLLVTASSAAFVVSAGTAHDAYSGSVAGASLEIEQTSSAPSEALVGFASSSDDTGAGTGEIQEMSSTQEFDSTRFEITVEANGDATWTYHYTRQLENTEAREDFETFVEEFESEEFEIYTNFRTNAEALIDTGSGYTDREMAAEDFNRSAGVEYQPGSTGVVKMSFTWTNFAQVDDDGTVTVGDVFDGGLFIGPNQTLVISPGDDLTFESVFPSGEYPGPTLETSGYVSWSGDREFLDGQPRVVFEPTGDTTTSSDESSSWLFLGGLVLLGLGMTAAIVWYRFGSGTQTQDRPADTPGSPTGAPAGATGTEAPGSEPGVANPDPISDEELMTDEDRVVSLIQENGGRMKQVNIVEETGWSKSKVSMLLSEMDDEGTISKLRVGRENIISLEGFEPEATKSPFEE